MEQSVGDCLTRFEELVQKKDKAWKKMFLGLMLILIGGFLMVDPNTNLLGLEFILMLVGLLLGLIGYSE